MPTRPRVDPRGFSGPFSELFGVYVLFSPAWWSWLQLPSDQHSSTMGTGASAIPPLAKAPTGGGDGGDSELVQLPVSEKFTPPTKELGEAEENCEEDEAATRTWNGLELD